MAKQHCTHSPLICSLALLLIAMTLACTGPGDVVATDPMENAPEEWTTFQPWAAEKLAAAVAPVAFPEERVDVEPQWPVLRLHEKMDSAEISCDWTPPSTAAQPMVELGPFASDQPGPGFEVDSRRQDAHPSVNLIFSGFDVAREQVGSVVLEIRLPFGRHFDLLWSPEGEIRVPIPDNSRLWTLQVATDGLADWRGPLRTLVLRTDGIGAEAVELRAIRFLPREASFPQPVGVSRVSINGETRSAIYVHSPAEIRLRGLIVPPNGRLQLGLGLPVVDAAHAAEAAAGAVRFQAFVEHLGKELLVVDRRLQGNQQWADITTSLNDFADQEVDLVLKVSSEDPGAVACWGSPELYQAVEEPPRVVVYLIDALGAKHVNMRTMPNLAALSDQGAWFPRMFANSPMTVESVADLMLSLPAAQHGVVATSTPADRRMRTLAETMAAAGFATASFVTNVNAGPRQGMDRGFDSFVDRINFEWTPDADRTVPITEVVRWLDNHRDRPSFVYVHTAEPHAPYLPPEGYAGRYDTAYEGQIDGSFDREFGFMASRTVRDVAHVVSLYEEEVSYADTRLGLFIKALFEHRLAAPTTLFVLADHGEAFLEHGFWQHGMSLHDELLRTPLVVIGPQIPRQGMIDTPVQMHDLMPTILAMHEIEAPYPLAGRSLAPLLQRPQTDPSGEAATVTAAADIFDERLIFASSHAYRSRTGGVIEYSVIEEGRWKLLYSHLAVPRTPDTPPMTSEPPGRVGKLELFNLESDALERNDVLAANPEIGRRLITALIRWIHDHPPYEAATENQALDFDAEQLRQLRSLGYIED